MEKGGPVGGCQPECLTHGSHHSRLVNVGKGGVAGGQPVLPRGETHVISTNNYTENWKKNEFLGNSGSVLLYMGRMKKRSFQLCNCKAIDLTISNNLLKNQTAVALKLSSSSSNRQKVLARKVPRFSATWKVIATFKI